ncbi:hypothetical protein SAMN05444422_10612 [Halobiforma haloterrestris]|uniref:Uncharacterized protein n=1 Tax=Natronobacterium haloterrestre TaxID=148448 RepID=A0A1I1HK50_NATHA|nr:HEPN domain-containing protein [Halobiforma haloterrestris]SFC23952.1 hypothetical protein SAMN05444422_10612 [Halobiforma haloterrestris]
MTEYNIRYRLLGPANIQDGGELGEGTLIPLGGENRNANAALQYTIDADNREEARDIARGSLQKKARKDVSILSFVSENGILLGPHYRIRPADAANQSMVDVSNPIDDLNIKTADQVRANLESVLNGDDKARQSLNWYNYGLATSISEDKLVALWTGIEAFVELDEQDFDEEKERAYERAKDAALDSVDPDEHPTLHGRIGQLFGEKIKQQSISVAVAKLIRNTVPINRISNLEESELNERIDELYTARNKIVHEGKDVADIDRVSTPANELATNAEDILRELLISRLPDAFARFIDSEPPERFEYQYLVGYDWILRVFDQNYDCTLTAEEIAQRTFALTRELSEIRRIPLDNFAGENEPLQKIDENEYQLNPDFDFEDYRDNVE